ncbi:MAG: putative ATP-dependent DNA ligase YkoU [candidate division WS6 bacterium OLB20]|uniref:DNA ligase (ATP) n=1 Tax=candidate division WS6 bacterium OLB20 TaxID=1617426 RepID=A0A136LWA5_9BACT|nr:MAG: putative ATP-dependent DNA ligase YkoU [candidate division WS6 bacterium OLB20]
MREADPAAVEEVKRELAKLKLPDFRSKSMSPMLASVTDEPFSSKDWLFEIKYDGYRMLAVTGDEAKLLSRNGKDYSAKFPGIMKELRQMSFNAVLDGEAVVQDEQGRTDFGALKRYLSGGEGEALLYVFDILSFEGDDLTGIPLEDRKAAIERLLGDGYVRYAGHINGQGEQLFEQAENHNLEGIIAKRADSKYTPGERSRDWLKVRAEQELTAVIVGFTLQKGREDAIGSLALAQTDGSQLHYLGRVGTGFSAAEAHELYSKLQSIARKTPPVSDPPREEVIWVTPKLWCSITYTELTSDGRIRHGVYHGLRDKPSEGKAKAQLVLRTDGEDVTVTHPEKLIYPGPGYSKSDVAAYFKRIAPFILPHLKDRPISMHRFPGGVEQPGFFHKDLEHHPDYIQTYTVHSSSAGRDMRYLLIQDEASLLYAANLGAIELHPWHSRKGSINKPDWVILDLDPHGVTWEDVITAATVSREVLDMLGIKSCVKTSGFTGMHIGIPLGAQYTYEQALGFMKLLQRIVFDRLPDLTAIVRNPDKRKNRIYLDILQNARGQTIVAPYSLRPGADAPVSTPLEWDEVRPAVKPSDFTLATAPDRFEQKGDLWKPMLGKGINLADVLKRLEREFDVSEV